VNPHVSRLGYLAYRKALLNQKYSNEVYGIIEPFDFEENELISVFNRWLGMSGMYRHADFSAYFQRSES
jgi:hypothetical protein